MVTIAQRLCELRTEKNLSRPALSEALGLPRMTMEKFETGRLTPSAEQQTKIASFFGVSVPYLRGESGDRTRMDDWMETAYSEPEPAPAAAPLSRLAPRPAPVSDGGQGTMMDALLKSDQFRGAMRQAALEALRTPEGQEILANLVRRELAKH